MGIRKDTSPVSISRTQVVCSLIAFMSSMGVDEKKDTVPNLVKYISFPNKGTIRARKMILQIIRIPFQRMIAGWKVQRQLICYHPEA